MDKNNKIISATTILAAISAYIYFVWFQFENGMCDHYKIPNYFIIPSISGLLVSAATIISLLMASFKLLGISTPFFKMMNDPTRQHMHGIYFINGVILFIGVLMLYTFPFTWKEILFFIFCALLLNLITWGIPYLFKLRQKKSFEQKIEESVSEAVDVNFNFLTLLNLKNVTRNQFIVVSLLIILPAVTYILGTGTASGQNSYECLQNENGAAVLKKYDDLLFCRKFDSTTKLFQDTLLVFKIADNTTYKFAEYKGILKMP